jgi:hypothetical protein
VAGGSSYSLNFELETNLKQRDVIEKNLLAHSDVKCNQENYSAMKIVFHLLLTFTSNQAQQANSTLTILGGDQLRRLKHT